MKRIITIVIGLFMSYSIFALGDCKIEILYAMNKSNPPSYTFKANPINEKAKYYWTVGENVYNDMISVNHTFKLKGDYLVKVKSANPDGSFCYGELKANFEGETTSTTNTVLSGKGKVKNFTGQDGCGFLIIMDNGQILNPVENIPNFLLKDGQSIELAYEVLKDRVTTCMKGISVKILKIAEITVAVDCKPVISFIKNNTDPVTYTFYTTSTVPEGSKYYWSFGDGGTSDSQKPSYTFKSSGIWLVGLKIVQSANTCYNEIKETFVGKTTNSCKALFAITSEVSNPNRISFINKSEGNISLVEWSFGDGTSSKDKNPIHEFRNGTYKTCLFIKTADGCSGNYCAEIKVGAETSCKVPILITKSGTDPVSYSFKTDPNQPTGTKYYWYFGDGGSSELANPNYTFKSSGVWVVNLKILLPDNKVCYGEIKETFTGKTPSLCKAYFVFSREASNPNKILFTNKTEGEIKEVLWNFGNGLTSSDLTANHTHIYKDGIYKVCLKVKSANGCISDYCAEIRIGNVTTDANSCTFNLIAKQKTEAANIFLFYAETKSVVDSWSWDFGDKSTSTLPSPEHKYESPGTYEIKCSIKTKEGCTETKYLKITVFNSQLPLCKGAFNLTLVDPVSELCNGKATVKLLDDNSVEVNNVKYLWSNGLTGNTVANLCPNKSYTVQVINGNICQKSTSFTMITRPVWKSSAFNGTNYFSVISPVEGVTYEWDFGDGNKKTGTEVEYNFSKEGVYEVTLKAAVGNGLSENKQQVVVMNGVTGTVVVDKSKITIYPNPVSQYLKIMLGNPLNDNLLAVIKDINGKDIYSEKINSAGISEISLNLQHLKSGIYFLKLSHNDFVVTDFKFIKTE